MDNVNVKMHVMHKYLQRENQAPEKERPSKPGSFKAARWNNNTLVTEYYSCYANVIDKRMCGACLISFR